MNNKILSAVLVIGIASTGFASYSSAAESATGSIAHKFERKIASMNLTDEQKENISTVKGLMIKKRSGTNLTTAETAQLEELKSILPERKWRKRGGKGHGKKGMKNLTDEEKTSLESMTDDEKKAFFDTKKAERQVQKDARKAVMDKLLAGTALTAEEEVFRTEIAAKMNDSEGKKRGHGKAKGENKEIMKKIVNGETLTAEEKSTVLEAQAKHEERKAAKETIKPIMEKKKAGTELTAEETATLKAFKSEHKGKMAGKRSGGKKGGHRGKGNRGDKTTEK